MRCLIRRVCRLVVSVVTGIAVVLALLVVVLACFVRLILESTA